MDTLPQELITEILLWLPVKSLLRFRCVSKSFCAIIESQSFINSHFKTSSENNIHRKLIDFGLHRTADDDIERIHALQFNDDFQQELLLDKLFKSWFLLSPMHMHFSHCNGLLLLCIFPAQLSLWNPSTRKYRILPAFPMVNALPWSFALGYDSSTHDYKALVIISKVGCDISQVWVFELRSSRWRRIQDFPYVDYSCIKMGGNGDCFVDGALHFICHGRRPSNASRIIVAFDITKETFSVVHELVYPTDYPTEVIPSHLHAYQGCLSVSLMVYFADEQVDMYVRKKDGIAFTWARLYSLTWHQFSEEAFNCLAEGNVAYSKEGNKVFLSFKGKLCSYDLEKQSLQEIATMDTDGLNIFAYTESLASVGS